MSDKIKTFEPTVEEILTGVEKVPVEIPELSRDDKVAVLYIDSPQAGEVMRFAQLKEGQKKNEALFALIEKCVVRQNGDKVFTGEQAKQLPTVHIVIFNRLAAAFTILASGEDVDEKKE